MRWPFVWRVAHKELLVTARDRRTLLSSILMPLLFIPLFLIGLPVLLGNVFGGQQAARQSVGVVNLAAMPGELRELLERDTVGPGGEVLAAGVALVEVTDPVRAVQSGEVEAALTVPPDLPERAGAGQATVPVHFNLGSQRAMAGAAAKVQGALEGYNSALVSQALAARGLSENFVRPVQVQVQNAATEAQQRSGLFAFLIPLFLLQFTLAGAMATALDSTAGEKERGTLEVLLVSPVSRSEVVLGKLLATTLFALGSAALGVLGFLLTAPLAGLLRSGGVLPSGGEAAEVQQLFGGNLSLDPFSALALLAVALSVALLISALLITVTMFAKTFKEAQTYVAPITLLIVLPAVMLQFAEFFDTAAWMYATPLVGAMLAILDLVRGELLSSNLLLTLLGSLLFTALLAWLATRFFHREDVIFRN